MQFLHVLFVAAGNNDGWTNNLFFIVLVAFWIIGAIVKAISKKAGKEQAAPQQPREEPLVLEDVIHDLNELAKKRTPEQPREEQFEPAVSFRSKTNAYSPKNMNIQAPPARPVFHEKTQLMEQAAMPIEEKKKKIDISSKALIKLDSSTEIRRAIVYYEILGKPISLRDYPFYD